MKKNLIPFPLLIWTCLINALILIGIQYGWPTLPIQFPIMHGANGLFFLVSLFSAIIQINGLNQPNAHAFVRGVTGGMLLKLMGAGVGVLVYYLASGPHFDQVTVGWSLLFYPIFLVAEVKTVLQFNRGKK